MKFLFLLVCLSLVAYSSAVENVVNVLQDQDVDPAPLSNGWNQVKSLAFVYYSYAAYCAQTALSAWNCKWCTQQGVKNFKPTAFPYDPATRTTAYIGYDPDNSTIVVVFRGSDNIQNWIDVDLQISKTAPYAGNSSILVHSGFYYAYGNLSSQVQSGVKALRSKYPSATIAVTGHSLGAALSIFCALDLATTYPTVPILVNNFGEPRCGNAAFASYYHGFSNIVTYRLVNNKDTVPATPPQSFGYHHHPTEVWEKTSSAGVQQYTVCSNTNGEDPTCSDSVFSDSVDDHMNYMGLYESCA